MDGAEIKEIAERLQSSVENGARRRKWILKLSLLYATVIAPILWGALIPHLRSSNAYYTEEYNFLLLLVIAFHVAASLSVLYFTPEDLISLTIKFNKFRKEYKEKSKSLEVCERKLSRHISFSQIFYDINAYSHLLSRVKHFEKKHEWDSEELKKLISPLLLKIREIFNYQEDSHYNLALYIHNFDTNRLEPVFRLRNQTFESLKPQPSRSWEPGVGHVGICFSNKTSYIDEDIVNHPIYKDSSISGDEDYYGAAISVPVWHYRSLTLNPEGNIEVEKDVFGVLILTSSQRSQFSSVHLSFVENLAGVIEPFASQHPLVRSRHGQAKKNYHRKGKAWSRASPRAKHHPHRKWPLYGRR